MRLILKACAAVVRFLSENDILGVTVFVVVGAVLLRGPEYITALTSGAATLLEAVTRAGVIVVKEFVDVVIRFFNHPAFSAIAAAFVGGAAAFWGARIQTKEARKRSQAATDDLTEALIAVKDALARFAKSVGQRGPKALDDIVRPSQDRNASISSEIRTKLVPQFDPSLLKEDALLNVSVRRDTKKFKKELAKFQNELADFLIALDDWATIKDREQANMLDDRRRHLIRVSQALSESAESLHTDSVTKGAFD